jgi:hypothetical protein
MPKEGFDPTIRVFERANTLRALDGTATVISYIPLQAYKYRPSGRRDTTRIKKGEGDLTILEAGRSDSSYPRSDDDDSFLKVTICCDTIRNATSRKKDANKFV